MDFSRYLRRALCCQPRWSASQEDLSSPPPTPAPVNTVIIGAGIIGLSTAYYLALALKETASYMVPSSEPDIVVIDSSHDICPGASGEATGGLGDFGFKSETAPLGTLSYKLHKELASKYNGGEIYEFSDLKIFRVSKNYTGNPSPPDTWGPSPPVNEDCL